MSITTKITEESPERAKMPRSDEWHIAICCNNETRMNIKLQRGGLVRIISSTMLWELIEQAFRLIEVANPPKPIPEECYFKTYNTIKEK